MGTTNLTCGKCGEALTYAGMGKPPKYCAAHRGHKARDQANAIRRARGEVASARESAARATAQERADNFAALRGTNPTPPAWYARLLAVGLGLESDPVRAGALMGLTLSAREMGDLAAEAIRHRDLIDRKPGALGALLLTAIAAGSVRLAAGMEGVPLSQLPGALRAAAQSLELVQGSTTPAYSEIRLVVRKPDISDGKKVA